MDDVKPVHRLLEADEDLRQRAYLLLTSTRDTFVGLGTMPEQAAPQLQPQTNLHASPAPPPSPAGPWHIQLDLDLPEARPPEIRHPAATAGRR